MTSTPILAVDLGKYKCVACTYDRATAAAEFRTITTSRAEVERLVRATRPAVVVIEACALAGWVHDLCAEVGVSVKVANTASEAWKYKHAKRKTDRADARRLAQLETVGQIQPVAIPAKGRSVQRLTCHGEAAPGEASFAMCRVVARAEDPRVLHRPHSLVTPRIFSATRRLRPALVTTPQNGARMSCGRVDRAGGWPIPKVSDNHPP